MVNFPGEPRTFEGMAKNAAGSMVKNGEDFDVCG
jgi:hypothetical protein